MALYHFEAIQADGKTRKGLIEGDAERSARNKLRAQGLTPISIQAVSQGDGGPELAFWQRKMYLRPAFSLAQRTVFIRQLASLIDGGLSLERTLIALRDEAEQPRIREIISSILVEVTGGATLTHALDMFPGEFPAMDRAVVSAGEHSGQFAAVLLQLANELEQSQALRSKLLGAALYPAIVCIVAIAITIFLLGSVVPQVTEVFADNRYPLPALTQVMLAISQFVNAWGWWVALAGLIAAVALRVALRLERVRAAWDSAWLKVPVWGRLVRGYNSARFASTLALLVGAGVPIIKALQTAAGTLSNAAMRSDALSALVSVREGAPLSMALERNGRFPNMLLIFTRLGEKTGDLPTMLQRAAAQISSDIQRRALLLATVLEPLLIVAMGGVVMLIVLSVLMPIIGLNQWVR
jgi:general secretion pathway protein F